MDDMLGIIGLMLVCVGTFGIGLSVGVIAESRVQVERAQLCHTVFSYQHTGADTLKVLNTLPCTMDDLKTK